MGLRNFCGKFISFIKNHYGVLSVILLAVVCFIGIFGYKALDIYNYKVALRSSNYFLSYFSPEDINTHYLGSIFYRFDDFHLRIFFSQNLVYPFGTSVLNTDSIPLFALVFKILYKFFGLSPYTQYFGIWILLCMILQGIFGYKIARILNLNTVNSIIASLFLILSPIALTRAFEHTALTAHFFILASIYLYLIGYQKFRHEIYWTGLFMAVFLTQPNFFPIVFAVFCADFCKKLFITKEYDIKVFFVFLCLLISINYILITKTGLLIGESLCGGGYGYYSANLNFLINPANYSFFLKEMRLGTGGQYEGICYLGLGIIVLVLLACFMYPKTKDKPSLIKNLPVLIAVSVLMIYGFSNEIYLNNILLFRYNLPEFLKSIFSIFRTSGRMGWIVWYMLFFFSIYILNNNIKAKKLTLLLLVALCIQIIDLSPIFKAKYLNVKFFSKKEFSSVLQSEKWNYEYKNYDGIFTVNDTYEWLLLYKYFWYWCIQNNKHVNFGYLSRYPNEAKRLQKQYKNELKKGNIPDKKLIYVLSDEFYEELADLAKINDNVKDIVEKITFTDGFYILAY